MTPPIDWPRGGSFVAVVVLGWLVTGALKAVGRLPCDLARKANHVAALAGAALWFGWLPPDVARPTAFAAAGVLLSLVAATCVWRDVVPFRYAFLANTRKSDIPHEALYFWGSWLVSVGGLVAVDVIWDDLIVTRTAALVVGIADGVAEPVGRRLGRHRYRVPSLITGKPAVRSAEGSAAAAAGCFLTVATCFAGGDTGPTAVLGWSAVVALGVALVEAVSPSGTDNLTVPLAAAGLVSPLAGGAGP